VSPDLHATRLSDVPRDNIDFSHRP
jgi:hypothetical protein